MRRALIAAALAWAVSSTAVAAPCDTSNVLGRKTPAGAAEVNGDPRLLTDGAVGPEGDPWNAPVGVTMQGKTASITYDLGQARDVSAFYMQGDANDTYVISGSLEDAQESYHVLATFPNVIASGHGLRARTVEIAPATVRYLRFAPGEGDGFFSITELAAYCRKPSPFPPIMKDAAAAEKDSAPDTTPPGWRAFMGLYGLGLVVLVVAALALRKQGA
jgi:hypothetical protein